MPSDGIRKRATAVSLLIAGAAASGLFVLVSMSPESNGGSEIRLGLLFLSVCALIVPIQIDALAVSGVIRNTGFIYATQLVFLLTSGVLIAASLVPGEGIIVAAIIGLASAAVALGLGAVAFVVRHLAAQRAEQPSPQGQ